MNAIYDYQCLANAIVTLAAHDWLKARLTLGNYNDMPREELKKMLDEREKDFVRMKKPRGSRGFKYLIKLQEAVRTQDEVEQFFRSRWYGTLTVADSNYIMEELNRVEEKDISKFLLRTNYVRDIEPLYKSK